MSSPPTSHTPERQQLDRDFLQAIRENSTQTVLMHAALAERLGLAPTDHKALDLLRRLGAMTAGQLAERTGLTSGAITGMADRLEKAGYVRRVKDAQDRRKVIIEALPESEERLSQAFGPLLEQTRVLLDQYTDSELRLILDFLRRATALSEASW